MGALPAMLRAAATLLATLCISSHVSWAAPPPSAAAAGATAVPAVGAVGAAAVPSIGAAGAAPVPTVEAAGAVALPAVGAAGAAAVPAAGAAGAAAVPAAGAAGAAAVPAVGAAGAAAVPAVGAVIAAVTSNTSRLSSSVERRILNGNPAEERYPYMVYLQLSAKSAKLAQYKNWICGGVIVSDLFVLTSAACVEDAEHFYVVPGSRKHVDGAEVDTDKCSKTNRRKVVWKCIPKDYDFVPTESTKWMTNDLAIIKVDKEFDFKKVEENCEFAAKAIDYNGKDASFESEGVEGVILGWGSLKLFREIFVEKDTRRGDNADTQSVPNLIAANVKIMNKNDCLKKWPSAFAPVIKKYMICTNDTKVDGGSGDCKDQLAKCSDITFDDAARMSAWPMDTGLHSVRRGSYKRQGKKDKKKKGLKDEKTTNNFFKDEGEFKSTKGAAYKNDDVAKTGGICENDHGGPLVVKDGESCLAVGIISACKIDPETRECRGPFLYTSIFANRELIDCIVKGDSRPSCRKMLRSGRNNKNWNVTWTPDDY